MPLNFFKFRKCTQNPPNISFNGTKDQIKLEHICLFVCICRLSFMLVSFIISYAVSYQNISNTLDLDPCPLNEHHLKSKKIFLSHLN